MKPLLFVVSLAFIAPSIALVAACGSSNDGANGTGGNDASTSDTSAADGGSKPHDDAGGSTPSDASSDVIAADGSAPDGNVGDTGPIETDGATASCNAPSDCRLYSSSCETCTCVPLAKNAPDPTCSGSTVSCFIDPCEGKMATCDNGHCGGK